MSLDELTLAGDYNHAVVQIACLLDDKTAYLIFASAELLPAEIEKPPEEPPRHIRARRFGGRARLYFFRFLVSAEEATSWYDRCRSGDISLLGKHGEWTLRCGDLFEEPPWPSMIIGHKHPISGDISSTSRTHHLFTQSTPQELDRLFEVQPDALQWVSDHVLIDLLRYPELLGSVHLLLPNPVLRSTHVSLHTADDGSEGSRIHLVARQGQTATGLKLTLTEHRPTGICAVHQMTVQQPYFVIPHDTKGCRTFRVHFGGFSLYSSNDLGFQTSPTLPKWSNGETSYIKRVWMKSGSYVGSCSTAASFISAFCAVASACFSSASSVSKVIVATSPGSAGCV